MLGKRFWFVTMSLLTLMLVFVSVPGSAATESCNGLTATIVGTDGDDVLLGTSGDDVIVAGAGDDVVKGKGGDDTICGGPGEDELNGGKGDDLLIGGSGHDVLSGNGGSDTVKGGKGIDLCRQGAKKKCERVASIERDLLDELNDERATMCGGVDALTRNKKYDWMAAFHSWDMAAHDYFSHTSPTYGDLGTRAALFEIPGSAFAENIFSGFSATGSTIISGWLDSDFHQENLCNPQYDKVGLGVIVSGDLGWVTAVFGG